MSLVTLSDDAPLDPDDELLVAYLDGELDPQAEQELMSRLVSDETLNSRLQELQDGWELLDGMPTVAPSEKLVESTLELVVSDIAKLAPNTQSPLTRFRFPAVMLSIGLISALACGSAVLAYKRSVYRQQLQDITIAENLDAYVHGSDMKLMRQLASHSSWPQAMESAREVGEIVDSAQVIAADTPLDQRESKLTNLSLEQRAALLEPWERFRQLEPAQEQAVRTTHAAVTAQPDAAELLTTMRTYAVWRETLPTEMRDEIEGQDAAVRRQAIDRAVEFTQSKSMRRSRDTLDEETVATVFDTLRAILYQRIANGDQATTELLANLPTRLSEFPFGDREWTQQHIDAFAIINIVMSGMQRSGWWRGPRSNRNNVEPLTPEELELIRYQLPAQSLDMLDLICNGDLLLESMTLSYWAEEAARRNVPDMRGRTLTAAERYQEMDSEERERIDLLPPQDFFRRLSDPRRGGPPRPQ